VHDPKLNPIDQPVASLGGVGRDRLARLEKLGIRTIKDLLWYRKKSIYNIVQKKISCNI